MRDYDPKLITCIYINIRIEYVISVTGTNIIEVNLFRPFDSAHIIRLTAGSINELDCYFGRCVRSYSV